MEHFEDWTLEACIRENGCDPTAFYQEFAGRSFYVPYKLRSSHPFVLHFGLTVAEKLRDELGGCTFAIPTYRGKKTSLLTLFLSHGGFKLSEISAIAQITERHVCELRKQWREAGYLPSRKTRARPTKGAI